MDKLGAKNYFSKHGSITDLNLDEVIAKCLPFVPSFKSKYASLKIKHLILIIPLNTIENHTGEKFLRCMFLTKPL